MRPRLRPRNLRPYSTGPPRRGRTPVLDSVRDSLREDESAGALEVDSAGGTVTAPAADGATTLPLSPVMDPAWLDAVQRHRKPKAEPRGRNLGRFRDLLSRSVYAYSLSQPVRICALTNIRLPRPFLQEFRPVVNEASQKSWWMPSEIVPKPDPAAAASASDIPTAPETAPHAPPAHDISASPDTSSAPPVPPAHAPLVPPAHDIPASSPPDTTTAPHAPSHDIPARDTTPPPSSSAAPRRATEDKAVQPSSRGPGSYLLLRHAVVSTNSDNPRRRGGVSRKMMGPRAWLAAKLPGGQPPVWREGMGDAVLCMLRDGVGAELRRVAGLAARGNKHVAPVRGWEEIEPLPHRGCVLWSSHVRPAVVGGEVAEKEAVDKEVVVKDTADKEVVDKEAADKNASPSEHDPAPPGQYATLDIGGGQYGAKMAVYNLRAVLGDERFDALLRDVDIFREYSMVVISRTRFLKLQSELWRLQGFLADGQSRAG